MSLFRRTVLLVLFCAFTGAPAIVGAQAKAPDPLADKKAPEPPADEELYQLEMAFKRTSLANNSFGSYLDEQTKEQIVVFPADADARALEVQLRLAGRSPQRLQRAMMTRAAQARLEQQLVNRSYHPDAGKYSMATYFDLKSGKQVLVTNAPRHVTEQLEKSYPNQIDLQFGAIVSDASRHADIDPFYGAAGILASQGGYCTSAWKVKQGTVPGVLAPGHCRASHSGPYWHFNTWDNGIGYGTMTSRSLNPDVALIWWSDSGEDHYLPYIYTGAPNSSTGNGVVGGKDPVLNNPIYYRTGAVTGEIASISVTSLTATYVDQSGVTHTDAMAYTSPTGSQGGDSGAPIFVRSTTGTTVHVRGFHTARATSGNLHFGEKYSRAMIGSVLVCASSSCYEGS